MRFLFTMNMPSFTGHLVHQVIGDHAAECIEELLENLEASDFIIVDEIYKDAETKGAGARYYTKGQIVLNCMHIGKVKEFTT